MKFKNLKKNQVYNESELKKALPEESGIYVFFLKSCCLYVGRSYNIKKRVCRHLTNRHWLLMTRIVKATKRYFRVKYMLCEKEDLDKIELFYIRELKPVLNKKNNS
jgi:excinuclease UvrABC nuclease subunit